MHVCQCVSTIALGGYSPGVLTFGRDIYLNIPLLVNIITLTILMEHLQNIIDMIDSFPSKV